MNAAVGLADLVRLFRALPPEDRADYAALLGFHPADPRADRPIASRLGDDPPAGIVELPTSASTEVATGMHFWRVEAATERVAREVPEPPPAPGLTRDDLDSPGCSLFPSLPTPPLASWVTIWSGLRASLQRVVWGRDPDVAALVGTWARGEHRARLPRLERRAWTSSASIWIDRSARLVPFWCDQDTVLHHLTQHCGRAAIAPRYLDANQQQATAARQGDLVGSLRSDPAVPVLVLGDLGAYGSDLDRAVWLRTAERLRREGVRVAALVPCPTRRWDRDVARAWNAAPWERTRGRDDDAAPDTRAAGLLQLIAPTALAQPGLVRALRQLIPAAEADAATEVDVWQHPDVQAADATGLVLKTEASARWRAQFASAVPPSLQAEVRELIDAWHGPLPSELLHAETLAWLGWSATAPPGDANQAMAFAQRLRATLGGTGGGAAEAGVAKEYSRHFLGALPDDLYERYPWLKQVWRDALRDVPDVRRPSTITADDLVDPTRSRSTQAWAVHQRGNALVLTPAASGVWPTELDVGSPIATIAAADPVVWVGRGDEVRGARLAAGLRLPLRAGEPVTLETDRGVVALGIWERPGWAVAAGRDRFGLWAAFSVRGVSQRMRWIPPGTFWTCSPEDEIGPYDDEVPQHLVTLTAGYWLSETPVTQALWKVVMGTNPSHFRRADHPVEQVSWKDCKKFIVTLNRSLDGLATRMPTQAEWERACRAGSADAAWVGELNVNDAPEVDRVAWYEAWYGRNSAKDFELDNRHDTSGWPEKQYTDAQTGTRPVGRPDTNSYGLHDMLGNVYEWCQDMYSPYDGEHSPDPRVEVRGPRRVVRGHARLVRAAHRHEVAPGFAYDFVGFRLAGSQVSAHLDPEGAPRRGADLASGRAATTPLRKGTLPKAAKGATKKRRR